MRITIFPQPAAFAMRLFEQKIGFIIMSGDA
jgi:hypothetical protein